MPVEEVRRASRDVPEHLLGYSKVSLAAGFTGHIPVASS